ncbi:hypothetical protein Tco_0222173 [Tanacetum coccineum]
MLEVVTALAAEEAHSESTHSRAESSPRNAQGTPPQSAAQASISTAEGTAETQDTADLQGTTEPQGTADIPHSPNDYTPTDESQTSGGDEGLLDLYALNREVRRLKKQTISQAYTDSSSSRPKSENCKRGSSHWSKSFFFGDEGTLSEEHYVQEDYTADHFFEDVVDKDAVMVSDVKSGDTEELDLETIKSTARQSTVTPRTLDFDDEAGPSSPIRPTQEEGLITVQNPKDEINSSTKSKTLETTNDEEVARKIQAEWDAEEERKRLEELKKAKPKTILKKSTSLAQERNQMMNFLKGQGYKNLQKLRYPQMKELYDKVQESIKDSFKDFIPMGSEKEKQLLQERDAKRLLRKRKATISEDSI